MVSRKSFFCLGTAIVTLLSTEAHGEGVAITANSQAPLSATEAAPDNALGSVDSGHGIGEIVVTAQKRTENVQSVPIAISAFNAASLAARGATRGEDLQQSVPGLYIAATAAGPSTVSIRGIGGSADRTGIPGLNPAVPIHVNGVYLQSSSPLLEDFLDIERVEVVRGPQGTLYGRNAVGGSINIITAQPTKELTGELGVEVGNYDKRRVYGILSGPLTDRLRGRIAFALSQHDPYVNNIDDKSNDRLESADYHNIRATVDYDLTDNILVSVVGYDYKNKGSNFANRISSLPAFDPSGISVYNYVPVGYQPVSARNLREVAQDTPTDGYDKLRGATGQITWNLGGATLKSISGYFKTSTENDLDGDGLDLPATQIVDKSAQEYKTFSQEFQIASAGAGPFKWLAGLYYYNENSQNGLFFDASKSQSTLPLFIDFYSRPSKVKAESMAAFGQIDYSVTDRFVVTIGARYTYDKERVRRTGLVSIGPVILANYFDVPAHESWKRPTWKIGANYHLTDDAMVYANYSRGYRAGGFNLQDLNGGFNPEKLDAYEAGLKSQWLDRRLQVNASGFYYDYRDKQEFVEDPFGFSEIVNAGAATLKGGELELVAKPINPLLFDASVSYVDAKYNRFASADPERVALGVLDLKGNRLSNTPKWQIHGGAQYAYELGDGSKLTMRVDHTWVDSNYVRAFNLPSDKIPAYHRTNATLTWNSNKGAWEVQLYVKNLENKDVQSSFIASGAPQEFAHLVSYLDPRTYGAKLRYKF